MVLHHAVETNAVAFGVLEDSNETMLADGCARLEDRTAGPWDAFQYGVEIAFDIEVNQCPTETGRDAVHFGDGAADTAPLLVRKHAHSAVFHVESLQGSLEGGFVEAFGAVEVVDVEFKPIQRVFFCSFAHSVA